MFNLFQIVRYLMKMTLAAVRSGRKKYKEACREFNVHRGNLHRRINKDNSLKCMGRFMPDCIQEEKQLLKKTHFEYG